MERVELNVMGITYSQVQQGAYALVLSEVNGPYRIPIVVGLSEAQAIAVRLENVIPPRPMPHDLFVSLAHAFGIQLDEVFIYKFDDGIFMSELHFSSDTRQISLDSRTSDAIALALRTNAPIYTTREILEKTGFVMEDRREDASLQNDSNSKGEDDEEHGYEHCSVERLEKLLQVCVDHEEYEMAADIKKVLDAKRAAQKDK